MKALGYSRPFNMMGHLNIALLKSRFYVSDNFMCYTCKYTSKTAEDILNHTIACHGTNNNFSIRTKQLCEKTGCLKYKSVHFPILLSEIEKKRRGNKISIDVQECRISFKRLSGVSDPTSHVEKAIKLNYANGTQFSETNTDYSNVYKLIPAAIHEMEKMNRLDDFTSLLSVIGTGIMNSNIAFHLILDVARFYSLESIASMRYSEESMDFWLTVFKLFKRKGVNFFRGFKGEGLGGQGGVISPRDCAINFAVPSDSTLKEESAMYKDDNIWQLRGLF